MTGLRTTDESKGWQPGATFIRTLILENVSTGLTDVVLSAHFLQYVDLLHRRLSDLLDLLLTHLVRGCDVDDLHRVLLGGALVDAAAHHAAHPPEDTGHQRAGEGRKWYCHEKHVSISGHLHFLTRSRYYCHAFICSGLVLNCPGPRSQTLLCFWFWVDSDCGHSGWCICI